MIDDFGLLAARLSVGLAYAAHGAQKALGWFEGPGLDGAAGFMESLGFKPGKQYATVASDGEIAAGLMIALGLGGPIGPAILLSGMIVAQNSVHRKNGFFAANNGIEVGVLYAAAALAFASAGYGELSLDRALGWHEKLRHPALTTLALAGALATGYLVLGERDTGPPEGTLATPTIKGADRSGGQNGQNGQTSPQPSSAGT